MQLHPTGPIGVFDSGIGGLTVTKVIAQRLPREALLYVADTAHVPYGPQPRERVQDHCRRITDYLLGEGCKLIVVACNTATAMAVDTLREEYPFIRFVGMEPAVKPAALQSRSGVIGVMATVATLSSDRYRSLTDRFAGGLTVLEDPCIGLVPLIEAGRFDHPETAALLKKILQPMLDRGADTIVLGCTHYPLVEPLIRRITGPDVTLIDPAPAAVRQTEKLLREQELLLPEDAVPLPSRFEATGPDEQMQRLVGHLFGQDRQPD